MLCMFLFLTAAFPLFSEQRDFVGSPRRSFDPVFVAGTFSRGAANLVWECVVTVRSRGTWVPRRTQKNLELLIACTLFAVRL